MQVKKVILPILISIACLAAIGSVAQQSKVEVKPDQYRAIHWNIENGLSEGLCNVMLKDIKGFLWVGSILGELCRFDGANFEKYIPDKKPGGINSAEITALVEDSLNNIWIGTAKGMSRYDIKADTFTNFGAAIDSVKPDRSFIPFWATSSHIYCMEYGFRIVKYDINTLERTTELDLTEADKTDRGFIGANYTILDTASNYLWILEEEKENPRSSLLRISLADKTRKHYNWPCIGISGHHHAADGMVLDRKRNSLWINSGDGLMEFSLADEQFLAIDASKNYAKSKDYTHDVGIEIDRKGSIWWATKHKGIFIYDPETEQVTQLFSDTDLQHETGYFNLHIYCDRDGIVWTSYALGKGIYELQPHNPAIKIYPANPKMQDSLSNGFIYTIIPGPAGQLWIGTRDGLNIFDPATEKFEVWREKDLPGIRGKGILPLGIDSIRQKVWLKAGSTASYFTMDMYELDLKTRKCRPIMFRDKSNKLDTFIIEPASVKPYKNGLLVCDERRGIFEINGDSAVADLVIPFGDRMISRMVMAEERFIFLECFRANNLFFENENGSWIRKPHLLDSLEWSQMFYDKKDQTYWVSFKYELVHYNKEFRKLNTYGQEAGYSGVIFNMLTDNDGNLWFSNKLKQIGRLNIATGIITAMSETDGYQKQDLGSYGPATKDASGNLYFGSFNFSSGSIGLNRIYPERYSSALASNVYIRSLNISKKPFSTSTGVNNLEKLSLRYNQNTISIETGIIDYYSKGNGRLRYKLEVNGKDDKWQYASAYHSIRYEGLPPGSYRLVMQASNAGNEFNSPEKTLTFTISPPYWQTWWFRVLAIICSIGLIYAIVRWRLQHQLERSEKERQMAELKQKGTELEMQALRAQMNPHFIFNSLNSINRFILQNNKAQASEYLTKFSKLVRMILQNSQASLITLESELESLELYLELEALRFDYRFGYKISIPKDMDVDVLKVPPLIIQPFAENAIWHGLMHLPDPHGQLDIEVSQAGDLLFFRIADNGIGRKAAAELRSKSATRHKSVGLKITADRIAMVNSSNGNGSVVTINDLVDADGNAAGTEVIIKMPVIYQ